MLLRSVLDGRHDFALNDMPNAAVREAMHYPHIHARWELRCDNRGTVLLTPPGVLHSAEIRPQWSVEFDLHRILARVHGRGFYRTCEIPDELVSRHHAPELCSMIVEAFPEQPLSRFLFQSMIASLDSMIRKIGARPDLPVSGETAERVNSYLHLHYEQRDLSLAKISEIFGMSQQYLNQCFNKTYGISIHSMLAEIRLVQAHQLLAAGLPVRDAARQTGWSSPFYFSDRFRRRFGIVPSQVRRGMHGPTEAPNGERDGVRFTS